MPLPPPSFSASEISIISGEPQSGQLSKSRRHLEWQTGLASFPRLWNSLSTICLKDARHALCHCLLRHSTSEIYFLIKSLGNPLAKSKAQDLGRQPVFRSLPIVQIVDPRITQDIIIHCVRWHMEYFVQVESDFLPLYEHGLGLTTWSPLASGLLTGKYSKDHQPEGSRFALEKYAVSHPLIGPLLVSYTAETLNLTHDIVYIIEIPQVPEQCWRIRSRMGGIYSASAEGTS